LVDNGFSVSRTADQLCVVQSAISQQLLKLENELNAKIFIRHGKKLTGLTGFGETVVAHARNIFTHTESILQAAHEQSQSEKGVLRVGTTHTQARYMLPAVIKAFYGEFPDVDLQIHQGTPFKLIDMVRNDTVDFSICTEALENDANLVMIPCYLWNRSLITLPGHPLASRNNLSLQDIAEFPIVTYEYGFTGRSHFSTTFSKSGLSPRVVLGAADTDVIKTYVRAGLGIGIIASMAYQIDQDRDLMFRDLNSLFPWESTKLAYKKAVFLRQYQKRFIDLFLRHTQRISESMGIIPK